MINSRTVLWTDGRGSFQWGWPRMNLGCHTRPVSRVLTVLLGSFPQVSSVASDVGPLVCSDVVGPWLSAVSCDFTRYPGLACFVQDPDVLSFVERRDSHLHVCHSWTSSSTVCDPNVDVVQQ